MNKIKIMDQVTVYQDVFSDNQIDLILNEINKSDDGFDLINYSFNEIDPDQSSYLDKHGPQPKERNDGSIIQSWAPWYTYGARSIWGYPKSSEITNDQDKGFHFLKDAILKVHYDYIDEYGNDGVWTYPIENWNIGETEDDSIVLSNIEILKHRQNKEYKYTIGVHTDWHNHRFDEPGPKQVLTYTIYINDDYEGGEIDFIDENNKHLIVYKPKRGDITVFPSGRPYWHGARAATSKNNKIFIRTFVIYRHPMTQKWSDGLRVYGPTKFLEIENERLKDSGSVGRQAVKEGDSPDRSNPNPPIFYNKETYIDGRI